MLLLFFQKLMSSDKSNQLLIREAIRKIALGRSMERINLAPGGMSGIGTARMIHGYVAKIHDNPSTRSFPTTAVPLMSASTWTRRPPPNLLSIKACCSRPPPTAKAAS